MSFSFYSTAALFVCLLTIRVLYTWTYFIRRIGLQPQPNRMLQEQGILGCDTVSANISCKPCTEIILTPLCLLYQTKGHELYPKRLASALLYIHNITPSRTQPVNAVRLRLVVSQSNAFFSRKKCIRLAYHKTRF